MGIIFYLFIALAALSVLIFAHELGHFLVARYFGVKVERFSIGFGKVLTRKQCCDTEWAFSAIPLGGYVKMKGQDDSDPTRKSYDPDSYNAIAPWQRIIVLLAGPLANFILAFFVYLVIGLTHTPAVVASDYLPPVVGEVSADSPAQKAGLQKGDTIRLINGEEIRYWYQIGTAIQKSPAGIVIDVVRRGYAMRFVLSSKLVDGTNEFQQKIQRKIIGIGPDANADTLVSLSPPEALFYAWNETYKASMLIARGVKKMLTGEVSSENVGGAITIFDVIMKFAEKGIIYLLFIMALISVNLGVLNLLPIPALDGGHIMFNLYEMLTRREPSEAALYYMTLFGWMLLFGLMGLGLYNDINRIWG